MKNTLNEFIIEKGKALFAGGIRHLGGTLETYGNTSASDALYALKVAVFGKKWWTAEFMPQMLAADFVGFENERQRLLKLPKFGNDDAEVDNMAVEMHEYICHVIRDQRDRTDLDSYGSD